MEESPQANETISHYRIVSKIGAGGMGEVYLAEDTNLHRKVAIKFLPAESIADEAAKKRLIREAQAAATLDHPNICAIHEVGEEDNHSFIVMQYIEGETLAKLIQRKPLDLRESLDIAVQVADALAEAHRHSIIHRDIKPQNIMITARGQVKVLDFGLARVVRERALIESSVETESLLTEPGMIIGTVPYMSPEQVRGEALDARSDIFSFGAALYEIVTGHQPFSAESAAATFSSILTREPPPLARYSREVPAELERIVRKTLHKDRDKRYQTARDLLIDLKNLKHNLEFDAETERSKESLSSSGTTSVASAGQMSVATASDPVTRTGEIAAARTTSSAEYVVNELKRYKLAALIALLVILSASIGLGLYLHARNSEVAIDSIAVLPFVNQNHDPETEYRSDGLTESIINSLAQLQNLRVIARSSVFRYKGKDTDPMAVGKELGVRAVLTGRMLQHGDELSMSAELVDVRENKQLWGERYERKVSDLLAVQREIAKEISSNLRLKLSGAEQSRVTKHYTENPEAYQLYLKGRFYWNKRTGEALKKSIEYFNQAIEKDPSYALAYAGLADAYDLFTTYAASPPQESYPKAIAAAKKALELDETLAEAHTSLGYALILYDWNLPESTREFQRAIELNPNYATLHHWYPTVFQVTGRMDNAIGEMKRAQELDPLSLSINTALGRAYYLARQYDKAIEQLRKTIEMDQNFYYAHWMLGLAYEMKGSFPEAITEYQKARQSNDDLFVLALLGHAFAASGKREDALRTLDQLKEVSKQRYVSAYSFAIIHAGLGERDQAFQWLEKSYQARDLDMPFLRFNPLFDNLRADPRFADLVRRVGLPQ
jgi:serine/threonine-protein kinase